MPEFVNTKRFRQKLATVVTKTINEQNETLIYNEKHPNQSFFIIGIEDYLKTLKISHQSDRAKTYEAELAKLEEERSDKYRKLVNRRYEKKL